MISKCDTRYRLNFDSIVRKKRKKYTCTCTHAHVYTYLLVLCSLQYIFDSIYKADETTQYVGVDRFFPRVANQLCILHQLRQRTEVPIEYAKFIDHPVVILGMTREIKPKYEQLQVTKRVVVSREENLISPRDV